MQSEREFRSQYKQSLMAYTLAEALEPRQHGFIPRRERRARARYLYRSTQPREMTWAEYWRANGAAK